MTVVSESQVLLVDDDESFANQYALILSRRCGIRVLTANTADEAIRIVREKPIKVIILDQVMPTKGTELLPLLRKYNSKVKSILLTAIADRRDMADASEIGFNITMLKDDRDMERLPMKILLLIAQYNNESFFERANDSSPLYVQESRDSALSVFGKKHRVEYRILEYETLEEDYVIESNWKSYMRIQKGQTISQNETVSLEQEFQFSSDFKLENEHGLSIGVDDLAVFKSNLSLKIEQDLQLKFAEKRNQTITRKVELKLLDDSSEIISRDYEYSQACRVIRVYLERSCSCCQSRTVEPVTVYLPIPVLKFQIKDHYCNGTTKIIPDGERKL